jgi:enamine deaminase RidA (YjgF/YER057c/UK114 family)
MTIQRYDVYPRASHIVVYGDTVYLAAAVAKDTAGESVAKQTQEILSIIDDRLKEANSDKSKLLFATIYLKDMATLQEFEAAWEAWVSPGNPPARATVEANLPRPQYSVEIAVIAAR